jgi:hypothetical protein
VFGAVGSKLQTIGYYIFQKLQDARCEVFYPIPGRYNMDYWNPTESGKAIFIEIFDGYRVFECDPERELVDA